MADDHRKYKRERNYLREDFHQSVVIHRAVHFRELGLQNIGPQKIKRRHSDCVRNEKGKRASENKLV